MLIVCGSFNKQDCNKYPKRVGSNQQGTVTRILYVEQKFKDVPASNVWNYEETNLRDDPGARK